MDGSTATPGPVYNVDPKLAPRSGLSKDRPPGREDPVCLYSVGRTRIGAGRIRIKFKHGGLDTCRALAG